MTFFSFAEAMQMRL